jgi:colanic acid biosynthesis glycosyl transferase WcaI
MPLLIFINRVYWPSTEATAQLLRDLTVRLATTGTQVLVITDSPLPPECRDDIANLRVLRIGGSPNRKLGVLEKLLVYAKFTRAAKSILGEKISSGDVVVPMTDPPMLGPKIGPTVRNLGGKIWHWSQDVYPEVALAIKPFGPFTAALRMLLSTRNREWSKSCGIVAIGTDMADRIAACGIPRAKIFISPNWAPFDLVPQRQIDQRQQWGIPLESFLLTYSGNLGRAHTLTPLIELVRLLQPQREVETLIVGDGPQKSEMEELITSQKLLRCTFKLPVPIAELRSSLEAADVHVITMRPDCVGTVWPSKFYGIVAVARPIIFIGPKSAEIAQLITKHDLGISVEPDDLKEASRFVVRLAGDQNMHHEYCARVAAFGKIQPGLDGAVTFWNRIVRQSHLESDPV